MPLTRAEIPVVADHYREAARHYKTIARILDKADEDITFWDTAGESLTASQITHLKGLLSAEKQAGDTARELAENVIAD